MLDATPAVLIAPSRPTLAQYAGVGLGLVLFGLALRWVIVTRADVPVAPKDLVSPMLALTALTFLVWLSMVLVRNITIIRGQTSAEYFVDYRSLPPVEWVERPARTFNNLMQIPQLFYAACLIMMVTQTLDGAQVALAWIFVAARVLHSVIYIGWNSLPYRFACWNCGVITLLVLWVRLGIQHLGS